MTNRAGVAGEQYERLPARRFYIDYLTRKG